MNKKYIQFNDGQVSGGHNTGLFPGCAVPCNYVSTSATVDTVIGRNVIQTMESAVYYPQYDLDAAHRTGYEIVMTTRLDSVR
jgi:hypothetical protein